jgi:signal transduction histidine kinase
VQVSVSDYGRGMTPEVVARAFDESFTTKPAGHGQGIGLFVCKSMMDDAGGRIEIESTPNAGTTVNLRFPTRTQYSTV